MYTCAPLQTQYLQWRFFGCLQFCWTSLESIFSPKLVNNFIEIEGNSGYQIWQEKTRSASWNLAQHSLSVTLCARNKSPAERVGCIRCRRREDRFHVGVLLPLCVIRFPGLSSRRDPRSGKALRNRVKRRDRKHFASPWKLTCTGSRSRKWAEPEFERWKPLRK